jgi:hypothetical protein
MSRVRYYAGSENRSTVMPGLPDHLHRVGSRTRISAGSGSASA